MNTKLASWAFRIAYAMGISVAAYNAVRVSQMYKAVREYGVQLAATSNASPYALAIQKTPESVDLQIIAIFFGLVLIVFFELLWKRVINRITIQG